LGGAADAPRAQARGVACLPSLENDELSDDALAGIGIDAAGILGDEDIGGALEGSEELEIARLLSNSCELGWTQKTKLN